MQQQGRLNIVIELLSRWIAKVQLNNALTFYDINKISEDLSSKLLNLVYDYELTNLNKINSNYPGIDLGDLTNKLAFQVTSRTDFQKIIENVETFVKSEHHLTFSNGLRFFILGFENVKIGKKDIKKTYKDFDAKIHIFTFKDLIKEISHIYNTDDKKFNKILELLKYEFDNNNKDIVIQNFFYLNSNIHADISSLYLDFSKNILPEYLKTQYSKYANIKTFLSSNLQPFYNVYYPVSIMPSFDNYNYSRSKEIKRIEKAPDLFTDCNHITLFGIAGSGKSTLVKHLFLNSITNFYSVPIVIELRDLNENMISILDFIKNNIFHLKTEYDSILEDFLKQGKVLLMFDGFDEVTSDKKGLIIKEIERFIDQYGKNKYLITTRPGTNIERISRFKNLTVAPLNISEVKEFIQKQIKDVALTGRIIEVIEKPDNKEYIHYLSNPLLLSMYILNFNYNPEIPKKKSKFYSNVFDTLYQRHDGLSKSGFVREKLTSFSQEEFEKILKVFSFISYFENKFTFDIQYHCYPTKMHI